MVRDQESNMTGFNQLTHAQAERLAYLCEEAGEVIQAANKVLRHGYLSSNPDDPLSKCNKKHLGEEIGQLIMAVSMLTSTEDISERVIEHAYDEKRKTLHKWMHHQPLDVLVQIRSDN